MEDYLKAIFNNSATSRQPSNKSQIKSSYFRMKNLLVDFNVSYTMKLGSIQKQIIQWALRKKCKTPFLTFWYQHLFSFVESVFWR